jgi:hypothetical protein
MKKRITVLVNTPWKAFVIPAPARMGGYFRGEIPVSCMKNHTQRSSFMKKNTFSLIGIIVLAAVIGLGMTGCDIFGLGDTGGNTVDNGVDNSGEGKTFTFTVKNELDGRYANFNIFRIRVPEGTDKPGLNIASGSSSSSLSHTVSDGSRYFRIYAYWAFPTIFASYDVDVNNDDTSFTLKLHNQDSTIKLEK